MTLRENCKLHGDRLGAGDFDTLVDFLRNTVSLRSGERWKAGRLLDHRWLSDAATAERVGS